MHVVQLTPILNIFSMIFIKILHRVKNLSAEQKMISNQYVEMHSNNSQNKKRYKSKFTKNFKKYRLN